MKKARGMGVLFLLAAMLLAGFGCKPGDVVVEFAADRNSGAIPLTVQFTDQSYIDKAARIESWYWQFGDGQTSTEQNPSHTYTTAGIYHPMVSVTTSQGAMNSSQPSAPIMALASPTDIFVMLPGDVPLVLAHVPAGSFMMGSEASERGGLGNEQPRHSVTIESGFYMGKYEITQGQWMALMDSWPESEPRLGWGLGGNYPAYSLSWNDAKSFIAALNAHIAATLQGPATMRLPSEAEWEYACRAGTTTRFFFGDSLGCGDGNENCAAGVLAGNRTDYLWYAGNNGTEGAKPVGTTLPNPFGLYDMSGNLFEWTEDDWHDGYLAAPANQQPWVDSPRSSAHPVRGGACHLGVEDCRSATRFTGHANEHWDDTGFRVVTTY